MLSLQIECKSNITHYDNKNMVMFAAFIIYLKLYAHIFLAIIIPSIFSLQIHDIIYEIHISLIVKCVMQLHRVISCIEH